jgi:FtsP/CotA-like multicopper oxidase with cupredoxin domain
MSAYPVTDERYPPVYQRTFTDFDPALTLHSTSAPTNAQYLPAELIVNHDTADVLEWTDVDGVTNTITFASAGVTRLRIPAVTITTNTTVVSVTVCWSGAGPYGGAG